MKSLVQDIIQLLWYAGCDSQTIQRIQPRVYESNRHIMKIYTPLASLTLAVLSLCSLFQPFMGIYLPCYVTGFVCTALSGLILVMSERRQQLLNVSIVILIASLLLFGVFVGTVFDPHNTAATYVALLFAIPLLFCLRPLYTLLTILINDSLFVYLCFSYKDEAVIYADLLNIFPLSIVSFLVSILITRNRIRQFLLEDELIEAKEKERERNQELEHMLSYDIMTDLGNYFSYLRMAHNYIVLSEDTCTGVLFADLNRLKYINDHQGHEEGNKYITTFAQRLKNTFSDCECFRLSGDEFLVVGVGQDPTVFRTKAATFKAVIDSETIPVSAIGYVCEKSDSLDKLKQIAEKKMYEDKLEFYKRFPEFKR